MRPTLHDPARRLKFRQAAIVYLHYAVVYWFSAWALYQRDLFPATRGPAWVWFLVGAVVAAAVIWALWWWQNPWFARVLWVFVASRLPTLIKGAFLGGGLDIAPGFYLAAGLVVLVVLWALARAGWDV